MIPSRKILCNVREKLHAVGGIFNPFAIGNTSSVETIQFDVKKMLPVLFKTYGIHEEAKHNSVELPLTCDGTDVTNNLSQMIRGFKMMHHAGVNLLNGKNHHHKQEMNVGRHKILWEEK